MHATRRCAFAFAIATAGAALAQSPLAWRNPTLGTRTEHAMAFDPVRNVTVLFGGGDGIGLRDDTWLWDGATWAEVEASGPSARSGHTMIWEPTLQRVILFGGTTDTGPSNETWAWDGASWAQQPLTSSPPPRTEHAMAWDPTRNIAVMTGGYQNNSGSTLADTWEWNAIGWVERRPAVSPPARWSAAMAFDGTAVVMFGGSTSNSVRLGDTWTWDGITWQNHVSPGPQPTARLHHMMASTGSEALMFGGLDGSFGQLRDTWTWNGGVWSQASPLVSPLSRDRSSATFDTTRNRLIVTGGVRAFPIAETWEYDSTTWLQRTPCPPAPRRSAGMSVDASGDILLFGGNGVDGLDRNDTWQWDGLQWTEATTTATPSGRQGLAMGFDPGIGRTVLFGGQQNNSYLGDTWEWTGSDWVRRFPQTSPIPRRDPSLAWHPASQGLVMFGGLGPSPPGASTPSVLADTWRYAGSTWTQLNPTSQPPARTQAAMATDQRSGALVLFGGDAGAAPLGDTWTFDGSNWQLQTPPLAPPPRLGATLTFHPVLGTLVLHGGLDGTGAALDDTWEFDGTEWSELTMLADGVARGAHTAVWHGPSECLVVHGGVTGTGSGGTSGLVRGDTRLLGHPSPASFVTFGLGCAGAVGAPSMTAAPFSRPWLGETFSIDVANLPSPSPVVFSLLGFDLTTWNGQALPLDLSAQGLPGCTLYLAPFNTELAPAQNGTATWSVALPLDPTLQGATFHLQALVIEPAANTLGATLSNGGTATATVR